VCLCGVCCAWCVHKQWQLGKARLHGGRHHVLTAAPAPARGAVAAINAHRRVLTMEWVTGVKLTTLPPEEVRARRTRAHMHACTLCLRWRWCCAPPDLPPRTLPAPDSRARGCGPGGVPGAAAGDRVLPRRPPPWQPAQGVRCWLQALHAPRPRHARCTGREPAARGGSFEVFVPCRVVCRWCA
jgi:hypothetical protein